MGKLGKLAQTCQFLILVYLPLYILRFHLETPWPGFDLPSTFLEILVIITVLLTLADFIAKKEAWSELRTEFDGLVALILISALIATLTSVDFIGGLGILKAYFV